VPDEEDVTVFEPSEEGDGYLVCHPAVSPETVDILNVYRPTDELPGLARLAVGLGRRRSGCSPAGRLPKPETLRPPPASMNAEAVRSSGIPLR